MQGGHQVNVLELLRARGVEPGAARLNEGDVLVAGGENGKKGPWRCIAEMRRHRPGVWVFWQAKAMSKRSSERTSGRVTYSRAVD